MRALATRTNKKAGPSLILQRIAERDKTVVMDCMDTYGAFIWGLARKLTPSHKEAESATEEIFIDIWRYCQSPAWHIGPIEKQLIAAIAVRRLIDRSRQAEQLSLAPIQLPNEQGARADRTLKYV